VCIFAKVVRRPSPWYKKRSHCDNYERRHRGTHILRIKFVFLGIDGSDECEQIRRIGEPSSSPVVSNGA
jgi:hypothetical protein